jgi:hypothetical protein
MGGINGPTVRKSGNGENPSAPRIPQHELKYWAMMLLSLFWFVFLTYILLKANNRPSVSQWWKTQSQMEELGKLSSAAPRISSTHPPEPPLNIPYPKEGDYYRLNFDVLAGFPAGTPDISNPAIDPRTRAKMARFDIPGPVKVLNGQKISVVGFMIPMTMEKEGVYSFILAQSQMTCCYGMVPKLNQWIYVTMEPGKPTSQLMDVPITVFGTLSVGMKIDKDSMGWCLYRMTSDKVDMPKKSWF